MNRKADAQTQQTPDLEEDESSVSSETERSEHSAHQLATLFMLQFAIDQMSLEVGTVLVLCWRSSVSSEHSAHQLAKLFMLQVRHRPDTTTIFLRFSTRMACVEIMARTPTGNINRLTIWEDPCPAVGHHHQTMMNISGYVASFSTSNIV